MHANRNQKKAEVATLISDEGNCKIKTVMRDDEGHYIMQGPFQEEDINIIIIYAPNIREPKYIR